MRIEVDKITDREIQLIEDIPAAAWEMDNFDVKFVGNVHIDCAFLKAGKEILVDGDVSAARSITCSRCLKENKQPIERHFTLSYDSESLGDFLEIDTDVREELLLDYPMKVLCKEGCKGLCPICGADLNIEGCNCKKEIGVKLPLGELSLDKIKKHKKIKINKSKSQPVVKPKLKIKVAAAEFSFVKSSGKKAGVGKKSKKKIIGAKKNSKNSKK